MKSAASIFASPVLCLAVLGGIVLEYRTHKRPEDAAPFHAAAKAEIERWPQAIKDRHGDVWNSEEWQMPAAAVQLLRPNAKLGRRYRAAKNDRMWADLLVVQCRDPNDMSGHYPPNCYPNNGEPLVDRRARTWKVGGVAINGMEYHFETGEVGQSRRRCVYNFFVLPGKGIVADMKPIRDATGDYQRRYFGAAQFQVVFPADMPPEMRDEIFDTIIGSHLSVLKTLSFDPDKI